MPTPATHSDLGPVNYRVHYMPGNPDSQVGQTIGLMWERVNQDAGNPEFQQWAGNFRGVNEVETAQRIWTHVKNGIRFSRDEGVAGGISGLGAGIADDVIEVIVRPLDMMGYVKKGNAVGDCDDFSMYTAALLKANGIDSTFATVAASPEDPTQFSHVYTVGYPHDENRNVVRVPMDTSHGEYCGWEVPDRWGKFKEWGAGTAAALCVAELLAVGVVGWLAFKWALGRKN